MKKAISLLLALVMCLALCACGGGEGNNPSTPETTVPPTDAVLDKNDVSHYLGVWKSEHFGFTFNKGGVGRFEVHIVEHENQRDFTYEVRDEAIFIFIDGLQVDHMASFELNEDGTVLSVIQHNLPYAIDNEPEYKKQ